MKSCTKFYYDFDRKYKLLLALFNNYYLSQYSSNCKVKCKVLIVGANESILIQENEYLSKIIEELSVRDIVRLRKFISRANSELEDKFKKLSDIGITDEELVAGMKKRYSEENFLYNKHYFYEKVEISDDITIVFSKTGWLLELHQRELFTDMVLLDYYSNHEIEDNFCNNLASGLCNFNEKIYKTKSISKNFGNITDNEDYFLRVYLTDGDEKIVKALEEKIDTYLL